MFSHPWTRVRPIFDVLPQISCVYYNIHLFCNVRCTSSTTTWTSVKAASLSLTRSTRQLPIAYHRASISLPFYSARSCNQDNLLLLYVAGLLRMLTSGPHWERVSCIWSTLSRDCHSNEQRNPLAVPFCITHGPDDQHTNKTISSKKKPAIAPALHKSTGSHIHSHK